MSSAKKVDVIGEDKKGGPTVVQLRIDPYEIMECQMVPLTGEGVSFPTCPPVCWICHERIRFSDACAFCIDCSAFPYHVRCFEAKRASISPKCPLCYVKVLEKFKET